MKGNILVYNRLLVRVKEELKDTKGVIRIRKSKKNRQHNAVIKFPTIVYCKKKKDRQHNGQKKDRQHNGQKKDRQHNGQKKKYKRNKQRSTKHTYKTKDRAI